MKRLLFLTVTSLLLAGCSRDTTPSADRHMAQAQAAATAEGDRQVGMPAIVNWAEKHQVKDLYELRDKMVPTWAYVQGIDGRLICLGRSVGFGIPYAVQFSNPQRIVVAGADDSMPGYYRGPLTQAEPNGLYMPENAEGTWLQMLAPDNTVQPVYVEPRVTVSPFRLSGPVVSQDCAADKPATK